MRVINGNRDINGKYTCMYIGSTTPKIPNIDASDKRLFSTNEMDSIDITVKRLGSNFSWLRPYCINLWTDLPPSDNSLMIYLKLGASYK
jgi:hypothetical protein